MFWWLADNTILAAALALLVAASCRLLRFSPAVRHALWLVVLLKLIAPPLVSWQVWAPHWRFEQAARTAIATIQSGRSDRADGPANTGRQGRWPTDERAPVASEAIEAAAAGPDPEFAAGTGYWAWQDSASSSPEWLPAEPAPHLQPPASPASERLPPASASNRSRSELDAWMARAAASAAWLWACGAAAMASVQFVRLVRLRRLMRRCAPAADWLTIQVAQLASQMELKTPRVLVSPEGKSPMVVGLGRPTLIWPRHLTEHLPIRCRKAVILHELAHLRRRDHWVGWIELVASCAWWWHPLLWHARNQLREAAELACDAWVVKLLPQGRRVYAEALIEVSSLVSFAAAPVPAVGMGASARRTFERRLRMILRERVACQVPTLGLVAIGVLALAIMPALSRGQAPAEAAPDKPGSEGVDTGRSAPQVFITEQGAFLELVPQVTAVATASADEAAAAPAAAAPASAAVQAYPYGAAGGAPAAQAAPQTAQIQNLEARLEQLLAEVRALRGGAGQQPTPQAAPGQPHFVVRQREVSRVAVPRVRWAYARQANVQTLNRATYKLDAGKADALAVFIKEHVQAEVDVKVDGEALTITAAPNVQATIAAFIQLMSAAPGHEAAATVPVQVGPITGDATPVQVGPIPQYRAPSRVDSAPAARPPAVDPQRTPSVTTSPPAADPFGAAEPAAEVPSSAAEPTSSDVLPPSEPASTPPRP